MALLALGLLLFCWAMRRWQFTVIEISTSLLVFVGSSQVQNSADSGASDLPFILFLVLSLICIEKLARQRGGNGYLWGFVTGVSIFLATDARTVGVALLPTVLVADFLVQRRLRLAIITIPIAVTAVLSIGQRLAVGSTFSYGFVMHYWRFTPIENVQNFYWALMLPFARSWAPRVLETALWVLAGFAAIGIGWEAARGRAIALFIIIYTTMLLILPNFNASARYLLPDLLVLGAFAVRGATLVTRRTPRWHRLEWVLPLGTAALGLAWWILVPPPLPAGTWKFGALTALAQQMFAFVRPQIPGDAIVAATKPRSLHLFTQRTTIRLPWSATSDQMVGWLKHFGVTAAVVKTSTPGAGVDFTDCPQSPFCRPAALGSGAKEVFRTPITLYLRSGATRNRLPWPIPHRNSGCNPARLPLCL